MKPFDILKHLKEILVAYGGWSAGGYCVSKYSNDKDSIWNGNFWGMIAAVTLSQFVSKYEKKEPSKKDTKDEVQEQIFSYRTDHVERINKHEQESNSLSR